MRQTVVTDIIGLALNGLVTVLIFAIRALTRAVRGQAAERQWLRVMARWTGHAVTLMAAELGLTIEPPPAEPGAQAGARP